MSLSLFIGEYFLLRTLLENILAEYHDSANSMLISTLISTEFSQVSICNIKRMTFCMVLIGKEVHTQRSTPVLENAGHIATAFMLAFATSYF